MLCRAVLCSFMAALGCCTTVLCCPAVVLCFEMRCHANVVLCIEMRCHAKSMLSCDVPYYAVLFDASAVLFGAAL